VDEFIIEVLAGNASPSREEEVRRWRQASAENEAHYQATWRLWRATEPSSLSEIPDPVDPGLILAASEKRRLAGRDMDVIPLRPGARRQGRLRRTVGWSLAAAAAVAAVALGISVRATAPVAGPRATFTATAQASRTVVLDDGTFARLAPGAELGVWDSPEERRVSLTGRAFFAVAHDASRPFVVAAGDTQTRVLGTRFEVAASDGTVRTVVVDGRVRVSNERGSVEVTGGSLATTEPGAPPKREVADDVYVLLDWPGGILLFQGTALAQVAREVGRHFDRTVEVRGERLPELRISGSFEDESFEEVVLALCETSGARCTLTPSGARIEPDR
jgi:transmembrane sensor